MFCFVLKVNPRGVHLFCSIYVGLYLLLGGVYAFYIYNCVNRAYIIFIVFTLKYTIYKIISQVYYNRYSDCVVHVLC